MDLTGSGTTVTFDFSTTFGAPKCIKVKTSQTVSFTGVGGTHPLILDCGPVLPITTTQSANFSQMFSTAGLYGAHCPNHGGTDGAGMGLAIEVVP
jgi:plastocyanin